MSYFRITADQRIKIQACINIGYNLEETALFIRVNRSTVYREIIRNFVYKPSVSENIIADRKPCKRWKKFPYGCNRCSQVYLCHHQKRFYDCSEAQALYDHVLHDCKTKSKISVEDFRLVNEIVSPLIKEKGQSIHHIYATNPQLQKICCERTIRRYIYNGLLDAKCHELPRFVRFRHKTQRTYPRVNAPERLLNRTFSDYLEYIKKNPHSLVWQYDSVIGNYEGKKAILTITFPEYRFQFGVLIDKGDSSSVLKVINHIKCKLKAKYSKIFEVHLCDNGFEFMHFYKIEKCTYNSGCTHVFYCNPYKSIDKAGCERNHEFIRYIIPKGKTVDHLTQEKVNLMFSHINSYVRLSNKNKTPYDLITERFGTEFTKAIGIKRIPHNDVCLKPDLIK